MKWRAQKIWDDCECWIIGGGYSISEQFGVPETLKPLHLYEYQEYSKYLAPIHDKRCIGINNSFMLGDWVDVMFFGDSNYFTHHRHQMPHYAGLKVSCATRFQSDKHKMIRYIERDRKKPLGINLDNRKISWNFNSGGAAINIAFHLGAKRIILLGMDMNRDPNNNNIHWHQGHVEEAKNRGKLNSEQGDPPFKKHMQGFKYIQKDAVKLDIEIINASPNSSIEAFPKMSVEEILGAFRF